MARRPNLRWIRGIDNGGRGGASKWALLALVAVSIFALLALWPTLRKEVEAVAMPDFASIKDVKERKKAFFEFLLPFAIEANKDIIERRGEILGLKKEFESKGKLNARKSERVRKLAIEYGFKDVGGVSSQTFLDLLSRVDAIPPSIPLSQAAIETAWGTSRFARQGNNLFGMRCYKPGCGLVPRQRPAGETYEVAKYDSPKDSFLAYMKNLNTNIAYVGMRGIRRALRRQEVPLSGYDLAEGLDRYSEEGYDYVRKIQLMIRSNQLKKHDDELWSQIEDK